jgi:26S proteasome regulatory subunit N3
VPYIRHFNRRTLDVLAARTYFYFSLAYEKANQLQSIRATLLELHCTAGLNHDEFGQEVLLNLLLRNYLHYNLYDQAEKLRAQSQRLETARSNQQHCRYLYYLGRIRAVQLEYTEAKECLLQAFRKVRPSSQSRSHWQRSCGFACVGCLHPLGTLINRTNA